MKIRVLSKLLACLAAAAITATSLGTGAYAQTVGSTGASQATVETIYGGESIGSSTTTSSEKSAPTIKPIFSQCADTYTGSVKVKISSKSGAKIYYTTDGKTPTTKSQKYSEAIKISKSCTLKAIAVYDGKTSSVASAEYVIQVKKPEFSVEAGYYTKAQSVSLTGMDSKTSIYYTTDGSTPTTKSKKYTGTPIKVSKYTVIKARAYKSGCLKSAVVTREYNIYTPESSNTTDTYVARTFNWNDGIQDWKYTLQIRKTDYTTYKKKTNTYTKGNYWYYDYGKYVTDTTDDVWVKSIVDKFAEAAEEQGYTEMQKVMMIVTFVQSIPYQSDLDSKGNLIEFPKYPLVTMYDQNGDCEDSAILLASMLKALGYDCALLEFEDQELGHMVCGISGKLFDQTVNGTYYEVNGKRYFYIEGTSCGWQIGEIPPEMEGLTKKAIVHELQ